MFSICYRISLLPVLAAAGIVPPFQWTFSPPQEQAVFTTEDIAAVATASSADLSSLLITPADPFLPPVPSTMLPTPQPDRTLPADTLEMPQVSLPNIDEDDPLGLPPFTTWVIDPKVMMGSQMTKTEDALTITAAPRLSQQSCDNKCEIYADGRCAASWSKWLDAVVVGTATLDLDSEGRYIGLTTQLDAASVRKVSSMWRQLSYDAQPLVTTSKLDAPRAHIVSCDQIFSAMTYPDDWAPTRNGVYYQTIGPAPVGATSYCGQLASCSGLYSCQPSITFTRPEATAIADPRDPYGDAYTAIGYDSCLTDAADVLALSPSNTALQELVQTCSIGACRSRTASSTLLSSVIALISTVTVVRDYTIIPFVKSTPSRGPAWAVPPPPRSGVYTPSGDDTSPALVTVSFASIRRVSAWRGDLTASETASLSFLYRSHSRPAEPSQTSPRVWPTTSQTDPTYQCDLMTDASLQDNELRTRRLSGTIFILKTVISETIFTSISTGLQTALAEDQEQIVPSATAMPSRAPPLCVCNDIVVDCAQPCPALTSFTAAVASCWPEPCDFDDLDALTISTV